MTAPGTTTGAAPAPEAPGRNLARDLEERAETSPDRLALIFEDGRHWTFAALDLAASAVARGLLEAGRAGDRVGLYLPNSPELVVGLLGAWKAGMVPVAMSALYGPDELARCIAKTAPELLVADTAPPSADSGAPRWIPGELLSTALTGAGSGRVLAPQTSTRDLGLVLFTGGTTGEPKAVAITHDGSYTSLSNLARGQRSTAGVGAGLAPVPEPGPTPNLLLLPLFHGGGIQTLLFAWHVGRAVVLVARFSTDRLARLVPEYRVDNLFLLPTMVYDLVHTDDPPDLSTVRRVLVAGQRLDPGLQARFETRYGVIVTSNYGSAELGHVAGWNYRDVREGRWKPGSVGRIYDQVVVEIRDPDGDPVADGGVGEIWVRTHRTAGYVSDSGAGTDELVRDGWVRSGDMGRVDEDRVLFLVGRVRELIKTGGFQVWPAEIEQELRAHPGVADVAVVGLPDDRLGEIPVAFVVPDAAAPRPTEEELIAWCRDRLAHFKSIRAVRFLTELPRSEAGKVQRGRLTGRTEDDEEASSSSGAAAAMS